MRSHLLLTRHAALSRENTINILLPSEWSTKTMTSSRLERTIPSTNTCVIDAESSAALARLVDQPEPLNEGEVRRQLMLSHHLSEALGGSVPMTLVDLTTVHTVLDVACGAGGWALDLACAYPRLQVTGIDACTRSIASAQRLAHEGGFSNVCFLVHDPREVQKIDDQLPGAPFDLIHAAFVAPTLLSMDSSAWVRALSRLCRPGGTVCWTETEFPITNSPALERLIALTCHALDLAECHCTPLSLLTHAEHTLRRHLGITPMLGSWFRAAGYQQVQQVLTAIEVSAGMEAHLCFTLQVEAFAQQIKPFLLEQGVVTAGAYEQLCTQVEGEVRADTFCGLCFLLSVLGQKPGAGNAAPL
jgi:ubiquinone/menaquinone biosynthesis C-methylase UbiE